MRLEVARPLELWRIGLDSSPSLESCFDVLDGDERARAQRFRFAEHRRRFIVAHAAVRQILGRRLGVTPNVPRFATTTHGKPFLPDHEGLVFSLSHSHELALCAVAASGELGVDVEWRRDLAHLQLARRFFAPDEAAELEALGASEQVDSFFACWTRKEAYIKAKGLGLSLSLDTFSVSITGRAPVLVSSRHEPADVGRFQFWDIPVKPGYSATLAYSGGPVDEPRCRDWTWASS